MTRRRGFTLIELLIVTAIIVIVSVIAVASYSGQYNKGNLTSAAQEIGTTLSEAETRSVSGASGYTWGVHFDNTNSAAPFFALFGATSTPAVYSASNRTSIYHFPSWVYFDASFLPAGSSTDIYFSEITGSPSASTTIKLDLSPSGYSGTVVSSSTVGVNAAGLISY